MPDKKLNLKNVGRLVYAASLLATGALHPSKAVACPSGNSQETCYSGCFTWCQQNVAAPYFWDCQETCTSEYCDDCPC